MFTINIKISTRTFIKCVSFIFAIIIVLSGFVISGHYFAKNYKDNLEYTYLRALDDLSDYISNLETTFTKGLYANTSSQQYNICAKLMSESAGAKNALSQMPIGDMNLENVSKFVSQSGDFASYLLSNLSKGYKITEKENETFKSLLKYSKLMNNDIKEITARFDDGSFKLTPTLNFYKTMALNTDESEPFINTGFREMNENFTDYPVLIYDGPFSDHITQMKPKLLENKMEISMEHAKSIACDFLNTDKKSVQFTGETLGNLQTYNFLFGSTSISITKLGGFVNYILDSTIASTSDADAKNAVKIADEFLLAHKIPNMKQTYYIIENGICTLNYAFCENDITYYSDLIKIGIALDSQRIVSFNASGYIMNHSNRSIPQNIISANDAENSLSMNLTPQNCKLCFVPSKSLSETFCYEFLCSGQNNDHVLVYINALTGLEEQILILLESDAGCLVM